MIVVNKEGLEEFTTQLAEKLTEKIKEILLSKEDESSDWISEEEARKILPIRSKTTWQNMRNKGKINFTQFGRKILYSKKSLLAYLEKHKVGLRAID